MTPRLSVVVLTLNEAEHVEACLGALATQTSEDFEVVVVDAASTDGTVDVVQRAQGSFPVPLRLEAADRRLPVGAARNRGVELARASNVAFLSADTQAGAEWVEQALAGLEDHDVVYGRQLHAPAERTAAAAVRGFRYHFPAGAAAHPTRYASNANAAIRRETLERFPFGTSDEAGAVDDILLTVRAREAGYDIGYNPDMVVAHSDVTDLGGELSKNLREAAGWGAHANRLGLNRPVLAWGILLAAAGLLAALSPGLWTTVLLAGAFWSPSARRLVRRWNRMRWRDLAVAFALSPLFDLAYLLQYLRYLVLGSASPTSNTPTTEETQP